MDRSNIENESLIVGGYDAKITAQGGGHIEVELITSTRVASLELDDSGGLNVGS
jgi:hypothetical protein